MFDRTSLILGMIALLAACKPLILLDFHKSFNDTRTMCSQRRAVQYDTQARAGRWWADPAAHHPY